MELDLQSLFGLQCTAVLIGGDPTTPPPPPAFGLIYVRYSALVTTRALLVNQDRRHLFVTPWNQAMTPLKRQGLSQTTIENPV